MGSRSNASTAKDFWQDQPNIPFVGSLPPSPSGGNTSILCDIVELPAVVVQSDTLVPRPTLLVGQPTSPKKATGPWIRVQDLESPLTKISNKQVPWHFRPSVATWFFHCKTPCASMVGSASEKFQP